MLIKSFYLCDIYKQNCMEISHWYHFGSLNIWNSSEIPEENVKWYCSGCKIVNQDPLNGTHLVAVRRPQLSIEAKVVRPRNFLNHVKT